MFAAKCELMPCGSFFACEAQDNGLYVQCVLLAFLFLHKFEIAIELRQLLRMSFSVFIFTMYKKY